MTQYTGGASQIRVAIIGSGPSGFYAADHLLKQSEPLIHVDMYERLPTPFGLVRGGVAPDHEKIKSVTKLYSRIAAHQRFSFYGNIEFGSDVTRADLSEHYHGVIYAVGAQTDRKLGIPGEDLRNSYAATEFVGWYNGHPDYHDYDFDLTGIKRVAVIGVGNVAMDVARILGRTTDELYQTDIADYALDALRHSEVEEIYVLGRRGPAQAAFSNPEIKELGEMADADIIVDCDDASLDELSATHLKKARDRSAIRNVKILAVLCGSRLNGQVAPHHHAFPGVAGRDYRRGSSGGDEDRQERALPRRARQSAPARHRPIRDSAGGHGLPLGGLSRRAPARCALL